MPNELKTSSDEEMDAKEIRRRISDEDRAQMSNPKAPSQKKPKCTESKGSESEGTESKGRRHRTKSIFG